MLLSNSQNNVNNNRNNDDNHNNENFDRHDNERLGNIQDLNMINHSVNEALPDASNNNIRNDYRDNNLENFSLRKNNKSIKNEKIKVLMKIIKMIALWKMRKK